MWFSEFTSLILRIVLGLTALGCYITWLLLFIYAVNKGKYKERKIIIISLAIAIIIIGITSLVLFFIALVRGQPFHVWHPFMLHGSVGFIWTICVLLIHKLMKKHIIKAELNKMNVDDLT